MTAPEVCPHLELRVLRPPHCEVPLKQVLLQRGRGVVAGGLRHLQRLSHQSLDGWEGKLHFRQIINELLSTSVIAELWSCEMKLVGKLSNIKIRLFVKQSINC